MSNIKHNLLHLAKIILTPFAFLLALVEVGILIVKSFFVLCGFKADTYNQTFIGDICDKWNKLP